MEKFSLSFDLNYLKMVAQGIFLPLIVKNQRRQHPFVQPTTLSMGSVYRIGNKYIGISGIGIYGIGIYGIGNKYGIGPDRNKIEPAHGISVLTWMIKS